MPIVHDLPEEDPCILLPWDSAFWGFPVGRMRGTTLTLESLAEIDDWCRERAITCLYFLARIDDPETIRAAETGEFRLADVRITLGRSSELLLPAEIAADSQEVTIRPSNASDLAPLQQIAAVSHRDTRFYFDHRFPRARCPLLYELWIARSCEGYADAVFVAESEGVPLGYITCHAPERSGAPGTIGLVGVAPGAKGRGIGTRLMHSALNWFAMEQVRMVSVVTQGRNIGAQSFYQRCGFVTRSMEVWYHKWYRLPEMGTP